MEPHEALPDWPDRIAALAREAAGYAVEAIDGTSLGTVDEVVWPAGPGKTPQLRIHYGRIGRRTRLVPLSVVRAIDPGRRHVVLALGRAAFVRLVELSGEEPAPVAHSEHLLLVPGPSGYELVNGSGPAPAVGTRVERDGRVYQVVRVGRSPLPGDPRPCASLL